MEVAMMRLKCALQNAQVVKHKRVHRKAQGDSPDSQIFPFDPLVTSVPTPDELLLKAADGLPTLNTPFERALEAFQSELTQCGP